MEKINLTKLIAESSHYSRRQAESLIRQGLVFVDGKKAGLGEKHSADSKIEVGGELINTNLPKNNIYIKLNKPEGYICTNKSFKGEKNIFSLLGNIPQGETLFSIGRLDKDSSGLLIITNDGDLTYRLSHPKFEHQKIYLVEINDSASLNDLFFLEKMMRHFRSGVDIEQDTLAKAKKIEYLGNRKFRIILSEGKKRQIREMFKFFRLKVYKLKRINFAGLDLKDLKEGEWKYLSPEELKILNK